MRNHRRTNARSANEAAFIPSPGTPACGERSRTACGERSRTGEGQGGGRLLPNRQSQIANRKSLAAAVTAALAGIAPAALADVSTNSSGQPTQNGAGNPAVTVSLSGSTAMRNFTTSPFITLLNPGDSITLSNGAGGADVTYTAPSLLNTSFQLASPNFSAADVPVGGPFPSGNVTQVHSAIRFEWHEQGATEGILDLVNDQVGYLGGATGAAIVDLAARNPSVGNPIWVNQSRFTSVGATNGLSLTTSNYNTYLNYDASGRNLQGGQNRVQMAIADMNGKQAFAVGGGTAAGSFTQTTGNVGYGKGNNNVGLNVGVLGTNSAAVAGSVWQLQDQSILNMSTTKLDPKTGAAYAAGPWNTAGTDNLDNRTVAIQATLFVANPGTGLDKLNKRDAQWLQTTGRFSNGAAFNMTTRDVGSGTRNVAANNTGVDPSWAVGVNDDGNGLNLTAGNTAQDQLNVGSAMRFSNKTAGGGQLRPTVQNNRMAVGTLSISDAIGSVKDNGSSTPLRSLDYSDSLDGSSGYVRASATSISDGSYAIWQQQTYVTVKNPNATFAGDSAAQWAARSDADTGIKGDNAGHDVADVRNNVLVSVAAFPSTSSISNAADGLLSKSFILPKMMVVTKTFDGGAVSPNPNYDSNLRNFFLSTPSYTVNFNVADPNTITTGSSATYGRAGNNTALYNGQIAINGTNYLFGNFNKNGVRDFAALQTAVTAQSALAASGAGTSIFTSAGGSSNATVITGTLTKGDLVVMGDFNGDGVFDGKDLYLFARGAALADSTSTASLTVGGGETLGNALRRGVLRKNAALDYLQANATPQQKIDASANLANDPTGANAFNKFDINRDGRVSRNDAAIVDKFIGADKTNIAHQLAATINVDGSVNAGTQKPINLYDVGLIDGQKLIATGAYTGSGTSVSVTSPGDFALIRQTLGAHLKAGDTRFRGSVDFTDINQIVSRGKYLAPADPGTRWSDGDFTGDNKVDFTDINAIVTAGTFNTGNYDGGSPSAVKATPTLTGSGHGASPESTTVGTPGDGNPDFRYDPSTGDVTFVRDGFDATKKIRTLTLLSAASHFITGVGLASQNLSGFDIDQTNQQSIARFGGNGITTATLDLGNILPTGLTTPQLTSDLTVYFNYDGSGAVDPNGVPANILVPEPTAAMSLVALGLAGGLSRRQRRRR
jgi:hypothetical protein